MINKLSIINTGPAKELHVSFNRRLNLLTGDNGLGKSFLLDIAWWSMTRKWPSEINEKLTGGRRALPSDKSQKASITYSFSAKSTSKNYLSEFNMKQQNWSIPAGRPAIPGLVFYAMADGSFAVWDPARNHLNDDDKERMPAFVFSPKDVWDGLKRSDGSSLCNGLIFDWAIWQKENGRAFERLITVLNTMSPSNEETIIPGKLTRISISDVRDMPTIRMSYGQDIALVHASSGMRRVIALAYLLVWCWEEHEKAKELVNENPERQIVFLIDEIESHLHPKWQRTVVPSLLKVASGMIDSAEVQIIASTHSPLIMSSAEPIFDDEMDTWHDFDLLNGEVTLMDRSFIKLGDASSWLTSEAFDLESSRPIEYEQLVSKASLLLDSDNETICTRESVHEMYSLLVDALSPTDAFLFNWKYIMKSRGLL